MHYSTKIPLFFLDIYLKEA